MTVEFYDSPAINATPVYTQTFTNIPKSLTNLSLTTPANARFVKIAMTENHGGDRYGIGNLMFDVAGGTPTSGSASVASYQNWPASNLLDLNTSTSSQWVTKVSTSGGYFNGTNPEPVLTFTYDTPQTISGIGVNPYNVAGNSVKDFNLKFYDASGAQISVDDPTQYNLTMTHYSSAAFRDEFSFPAVANVSKIEMTLTSNFIAEVGSAGDRVGLSEVCFFVPTEPDAPTTPDKYNASMSNENVIVRPESASFLTKGAERASAKPLSNLFDGTESSPGGNEWYTIDTKVGNTVISDYYTVGYTPAIEFTMPEENMYNSFSIWGYGNKGNLMSDFTLELYDREGKLVYADEYLIDSYINKSQYATFSLGQNYLFEKVVLTVLDNGYDFYEGFTGGDRVGFAEIAFYQDPYYFVNTDDMTEENWTIDGTGKKGVSFTQGSPTATFANPVIMNASGTFDIQEGNTLILSGGVSGSGNIEKTGAGTLTLYSSSENPYSGVINVTEGRLNVQGSVSGGYTVNENTVFSPGDPIGEASFDGAFVLKNGATLLLEQDASGMDSLIADSFLFEEGSTIVLCPVNGRGRSGREVRYYL